jgi:hypothetical protein
VNRPLNLYQCEHKHCWVLLIPIQTEKVGEAMCVYGLRLFDDENIVPLECMVVLLLL